LATLSIHPIFYRTHPTNQCLLQYSPFNHYLTWVQLFYFDAVGGAAPKCTNCQTVRHMWKQVYPPPKSASLVLQTIARNCSFFLFGNRWLRQYFQFARIKWEIVNIKRQAVYIWGSRGLDRGVIEFLTASVQHYSQQIGSNNTFLGWVAACSFAISCKGI